MSSKMQVRNQKVRIVEIKKEAGNYEKSDTGELVKRDVVLFEWAGDYHKQAVPAGSVVDVEYAVANITISINEYRPTELSVYTRFESKVKK